MCVSKLHNRALYAFLCFLPVALQIQATLFSNASYQGLRFNVADLLLPVAGTYILLSFYLKKSQWPKWDMKHTWLWLIALLGVMSVALVNGYISNGYWSSWALVNKYIGFIILLCYFSLGGWLSTNFSQLGLSKEWLVRIFCGFCLVILSLSFVSTLIKPLTTTPMWLGEFPWDGLMANRNAFMVLTIFTVTFMEAYRLSKQPILPAWSYALFWIIVPTFTVFNASRIGWIVGGVVLLGMLFKAPVHFVKKILPYLFIGCLAAYAGYLGSDKLIVKEGRMLQYLVDSVKQNEITYQGDQARFIALEDGLDLYRQ